MSHQSWNLTDLLSTHDPKEPLSAELLASVAERVEAAIGSSSRELLFNLSDQLACALSAQLNSADTSVRHAFRGSEREPGNSNINVAFALGQLNFAHLITAQAAERRADESFLSALKERRFAKYFERLARSDATGVELASCTGHTEETVSRNMRHLRSLGITDFRREGKNVINFLTPAAVAGLGVGTASLDNEIGHESTVVVAAMRDSLSAYMRKPITFAPSETKLYDLAA